jgi:malonate transporter MadL subunit
MVIYGVAPLSLCLLIGMFAGEVLGLLLNLQANVGGVGIAMLLLLFASNSKRFQSLTHAPSSTGVEFWSAMYIPIVVAMAARQNVAGALDGGLLALIAGSSAVVVSFALVPIISRLASANRETSDRQDLP